ncbi:MAG: hypothetical protein ACFFAB_11555 [Candidatus Heimdallarchaeota archaeon]
MAKEKWKFFLLFFYAVILLMGIILLFLNIDLMSVIHASESEWLPVIKYETYSSLDTIFIYVFIVLVVINFICISIAKLMRILPFVLILTPIISFIFILALFFNPHLLIINPTGLPPTQLDALEIGGLFSIILSIVFIFLTVMALWFNKDTKLFLKIRGKQ